MIIAIDGTSSSGKSTISRELGRRLGINVLGTGSLYRSVALKMLNLSISIDDDERIKQMLEKTIIESKFSNGTTTILLDGIAQSLDRLNEPDVSELSALVAQKPYVRDFVRKIQRSMAEKSKHIIVEGRDIGSVVFPEAEIKLFIDADIVTRAKRRQAEYIKNGENIPLKKVIKQLEDRDIEDRKRDISPLIMTSDAIIIDTSSTPVSETVDRVISIITERTSKK